MIEHRKGMLLVVSGPAGAGKGTLIKELLDNDPTFGFSVSATTRARRENEVDGVHYHFMSEEEYDRLVAEDAFLEYATVHNHRYGTLKREVDRLVDSGRNVVLDIDPQGALNVMAKVPECVSIYILPPSYAEEEKRLRGRGTEDEEELQKRLRNGRREMELKDRYTYIIVNDEKDKATELLMTIVRAEKQRSCRYMPEIEEK